MNIITPQSLAAGVFPFFFVFIYDEFYLRSLCHILGRLVIIDSFQIGHLFS